MKTFEITGTTSMVVEADDEKQALERLGEALERLVLPANALKFISIGADRPEEVDGSTFTYPMVELVWPRSMRQAWEAHVERRMEEPL